MNVQLKERYDLYIDGQWVPASDGTYFTSKNPATGEALAQFAQATKEDVDAAVKAAWKAFPEWKAVEPSARAAILMKIADRIDENAELLAQVETMDNGKPIRETMAIDVPYSSDHFRYFAGAIRTTEGTATVLDGNFMSLVLREPIGVVGQIVPWNFPFLMAAWKLAPALAAGNCIVFKPSSSTSLSMAVFMELIEDLLPPGVINIVTGAGSKSGQYLLDHPDIRKLAFTGSSEVGVGVAQAAAEKLIPATLELGGKSANIYFEDCQWDMAIDGLQLGILFNQGQVCCAGSRVFVQESIYDKFVEAAVDAFNKVTVGNPLDPNTQMGSQINMAQVEKILGYIELAKEEGATILCGGERYMENGCENGCFIKMPSCRKKFSDRWPLSSNSARKTKSSPWPTIPNTDWAALSGREISTAPSAYREPSKRDVCGSTPTIRSLPALLSADTNVPASAARQILRFSSTTLRRKTS